MEYREIRAFLEIARTGSFGRAASRMGLTQPALSRQIAKLERELGATLFERNPEIKLTHQGEEFIPRAIRLQDAYQEAMDFHREKTEEIQGEYSISTGSTVAACVLPGVISRIVRSSPRVRFRVFEGDAARTADSLIWGDVDLGILTDGVFRKSSSLSLQSRYFFSDWIVPVVGKKHPLSKKSNFELEDLSDSSFVMFHNASSIRRAAEEQMRKAGIILQKEPVMELRGIESVRSALEEGLGVGFISHLYLSKRLHVLDFPELRARRDFHFYFRDSYRTGLVPLMDSLESVTSQLFKENNMTQAS